jgi:hypothetical protein
MSSNKFNVLRIPDGTCGPMAVFQLASLLPQRVRFNSYGEDSRKGTEKTVSILCHCSRRRWQSSYLSIQWSTCPSVCLSVHQWSIQQSTYRSTHQSIHPFMCNGRKTTKNVILSGQCPVESRTTQTEARHFCRQLLMEMCVILRLNALWIIYRGLHVLPCSVLLKLSQW